MSASETFLPDYLRPFVAKQDPTLYTPMDHAGWRFILRASRSFFSTHAHEKYHSGLAETGISVERIPLIEEMDEKLKRFGWRAVAVSGFIPPAVFMEFQSLGVLPIACEMRTLEHLAYTPAPDIVHEAAGHAPIIADPEYSTYLRAYGEISRKAIFSYQDMDVYEAVRNLSIVKEDPRSSSEEVSAAQSRLDEALGAVTFSSEATLMARMNWWTVEYGLVGSLDEPRIYGAGLLSSLGESYHCLDANVRRLPLTVGCIEQGYDITKAQPQLFVAKDFHHLTQVLEEFAETMAYRKGGEEGLAKAVQARTVCTVELDSSLQISGLLENYRVDPQSGEPAYLKFSGPTQLSAADQEIANQGPEYHREGFSTVLGLLDGIGKSPAELTAAELASLTDREGVTKLSFASGIIVSGKLGTPFRKNDRNLILPFTNCTAEWNTAKGTDVLFKPEWGTFDLGCGARVVSVFGGAADRKNYIEKTGGFKQLPLNPKCNLTNENRDLNHLYARIRALRENPLELSALESELSEIERQLEEKYPADWLSRVELLELSVKYEITSNWISRAHTRLEEISKRSSELNDLIARGLSLIKLSKGSA